MKSIFIYNIFTVAVSREELSSRAKRGIWGFACDGVTGSARENRDRSFRAG